MDERLVNRIDAARMVAYSPKHFSVLVSEGKMPQPVNMTGTRKGYRWRYSELQKWIKDHGK